MPTPSIREIVAPAANVATSQTLNLGASLAVGDLIVLLHGYDYNAASNMTTPTGTAVTTWTLRATGDAGTNFFHVKLWTGVVTSGGSGKTVIANADLDTASHMAQAVVVSTDGVTLSVDGNPIGNQGSTSTNHVFGSVTGLTVSDGLYVGMAGTSPSGSGDYSVASSGLTKQTEIDASIFSTACSFTQNLASSSDTGTKTVTCTANQEWATAAIVIKAVTAGLNINAEVATGVGTAETVSVPINLTAGNANGAGSVDTNNFSGLSALLAEGTGEAPTIGLALYADNPIEATGEAFNAAISSGGGLDVNAEYASGLGAAYNPTISSGGGPVVPVNSSVMDEARLLMLSALGLTEPQNLSNTDLMRLVILEPGQTLVTVTSASAAVHLARFCLQLGQD